MNVFEFILGICLIGTISGVITGGMKLKREKIRAQARGYGETRPMRCAASSARCTRRLSS